MLLGRRHEMECSTPREYPETAVGIRYPVAVVWVERENVCGWKLRLCSTTVAEIAPLEASVSTVENVVRISPFHLHASS